MKLKRMAGLAAAGLLALTTACGQDGTSSPAADTSAAADGEPIVLEHAGGTTELQGPAKRVVVLDYSALDTLDAIDMEDVVVGAAKGTQLPESLDEYAGDDVENVGTLKEPDLEKIASLDPDLLIAGGRTSEMVPELMKLFPTIDVTLDADADYMEGMAASALLVGKAVGKEAEVQAELDELQAEVEEAKGKIPAESKVLSLMSSGGKISAIHPNGRFDLAFDALGLTPAIEKSAEEGQSHGDALSFEAIQQANPDIIYVIDRDAAIGTEGGQAAAQVLDNELVHATNAWKNDKVIYLDASPWYLIGHGLDTTETMLEELLEAA